MGKSKKEKKKEIKKFSDWLEGRVFRVDPDRRNFEDHSGLRQYFMTQTGQSGPVSLPDTIPNWGKSLKGSFRRGLYAGKYHDVVSYFIPRELPVDTSAHFSKKNTLY